MAETLHMRVGSNIGDICLEICQTNISDGNIEKALDVYRLGFGMDENYIMMLLKNEAVLIADSDGLGVTMKDNLSLLKENAHNIFDWNGIINSRLDSMNSILESLRTYKYEFDKLYVGDIENYSIMSMMQRYYTNEYLKVMSGKAHIAARIIGSFDGKILDTGSDNPYGKWLRLCDEVEHGSDEAENWEKILYFTVNYVNLIKRLHNEYMNFENTYMFLVKNGFINRPIKIESTIERILSVLMSFADTTKGYYHPLCNEGLYKYKDALYEDLSKTKYGHEFIHNGLLVKEIMDGYDAGWLSPDGEFYAGDGETSSMIHMNIAEEIYNGKTNKYAVAMFKDHVNILGASDSPEYWLESHGWVKIHHDEVYGSFIGNKTPTKDYPYPYAPTDTQIKMICNYIDKYYNGALYTHPKIVKTTNPVYTGKLRQMDEIMLHTLFK